MKPKHVFGILLTCYSYVVFCLSFKCVHIVDLSKQGFGEKMFDGAYAWVSVFEHDASGFNLLVGISMVVLPLIGAFAIRHLWYAGLAAMIFPGLAASWVVTGSAANVPVILGGIAAPVAAVLALALFVVAGSVRMAKDAVDEEIEQRIANGIKKAKAG
jgi:hypothetical protein